MCPGVRAGTVRAVRRSLLAAGLAIVVLAAVGGMAAGAPAVVIDDVAQALQSDPVYVDPDAERALSAEEVDEVRAAIRSANTPIYIAVLPAAAADAAGGDPAEVASQLAAAVGRAGTYAVVVGDRFRAGSSELPAGQAAELARQALDAQGDDTSGVLVDFVQRVGDAAAGESGGGSGSGDGGGGGGGGGFPWLGVLLAGGAAVGGYSIWRGSQRRKAEAAERARAEEADRQMLRAEIQVLADDVVRHETEVQLHPEAQADYDAAVNRYRAAEAALDYADEPVDLVRVERVVAEARYSMDRARAIIDGREPPAPPEELRQPGRHGEPAVTIDEQRQPAYVGYPGGYSGGWFGGMGGGGLFSGLLLGSLLGGFGGWGHGGPRSSTRPGTTAAAEISAAVTSVAAISVAATSVAAISVAVTSAAEASSRRLGPEHRPMGTGTIRPWLSSQWSPSSPGCSSAAWWGWSWPVAAPSGGATRCALGTPPGRPCAGWPRLSAAPGCTDGCGTPLSCSARPSRPNDSAGGGT